MVDGKTEIRIDCGEHVEWKTEGIEEVREKSSNRCKSGQIYTGMGESANIKYGRHGAEST